jgi:hypothetical protein
MESEMEYQWKRWVDWSWNKFKAKTKMKDLIWTDEYIESKDKEAKKNY